MGNKKYRLSGRRGKEEKKRSRGVGLVGWMNMLEVRDARDNEQVPYRSSR